MRFTISDQTLTVHLSARSTFEAIRKRNKARDLSQLLHPHLDVVEPPELVSLIHLLYSLDRITKTVIRKHRRAIIECITGASPLLSFFALGFQKAKTEGKPIIETLHFPTRADNP